MTQKNSLDVEFNPVKLYLNDLLQIESYLKELPNFEKIVISADDHEHESFSEIPSLFEECNKLRMTIHHNKYKSFTISFGTFRNTISDYDPSLEVRGVVQKITTVLNKNEKTFWVKLKKLCKYLFYPVLGILYLIGSIGDFNKIKAIIFLSILLSLIIMGVYGLLPLKSNLIFANRKDRKSWWERNKDPLIVGLICSIVGAILGGFVGYFLAKGI